MSTNQSRAYGSDCMGRVFIPTNVNKYISLFETSNKNGAANNYMQNNERSVMEMSHNILKSHVV